MPLKIAAKIDAQDRAYWEAVVEPLIVSHSNVEYIGEIDEGQKAASSAMRQRSFFR